MYCFYKSALFTWVGLFTSKQCYNKFLLMAIGFPLVVVFLHNVRLEIIRLELGW